MTDLGTKFKVYSLIIYIQYGEVTIGARQKIRHACLGKPPKETGIQGIFLGLSVYQKYTTSTFHIILSV